MSGDAFDFSEFMDSYVADLSRALNALKRDSVGKLYTEMLQVMDNGGKVHFIGNGGSAATPSHSAGDWSKELGLPTICLLYTSPSPRDATLSRMPSSA